MAPADACLHDMLVLVRWQGRKVGRAARSTPPLSIQTNQRLQLSVTGTIGSRREPRWNPLRPRAWSESSAAIRRRPTRRMFAQGVRARA